MAHTIEPRFGSASRAAAMTSGAFKAVRGTIFKCLEIIIIWQERAEQRHALRELDSRLLKDIGISRADASQEARKPFWQP